MRYKIPSIIALSLAYMCGYLSAPHPGFYLVFLVGWVIGYIFIPIIFPHRNYDQ
jgi:hypothetical protein